MGDQDCRCAIAPNFVTHQHEYVPGGIRVKVARRLVSEDQFRVVYQRSADGYTLQFAARKLPGKMGSPIAKPHCRQHLFGPL